MTRDISRRTLGELALGGAATDELIKEINAFDREPIRQQAKAFKCSTGPDTI